METLRPKAAPAVLAIKLEKPGKLQWRAGHYLVIENDVPRTMKPAEVEERFDRAESDAPVAAPARRPRRAGGRPGRQPKKEKPAAPQRVLPASAPAKRTGRPSAHADKMGEARRLVVEEGKSITETAKELDLPYRTVWGWSKANGWETR